MKTINDYKFTATGTVAYPTNAQGTHSSPSAVQSMTLDFKDIKHYRSIIHVLRQTARIMKEINNK